MPNISLTNPQQLQPIMAPQQQEQGGSTSALASALMQAQGQGQPMLNPQTGMQLGLMGKKWWDGKQGEVNQAMNSIADY